MRVTIRYFARVRELLGEREDLDFTGLPDAPRTVGALQAWLAERSDVHRQALSGDRCLRAALDQALCDDSELLHDGAEVAFFPPVTGG